MPSIYVEIEISAARSLVWEALVQKERWMQWNTFLFDRSPNQPFGAGRSLLLSLKRTPEETETQFQARITLFKPDSCMKWVSTAPGYRSEHSFELQEIGLNRTKYTHRESLSGGLMGLFLPFIRQDERAGMRRMAMEIKRYAEWRGER